MGLWSWLLQLAVTLVGVFLGIFLAELLDRKRARRKNRQRECQVLRLLKPEIQVSVACLEAFVRNRSAISIATTIMSESVPGIVRLEFWNTLKDDFAKCSDDLTLFSEVAELYHRFRCAYGHLELLSMMHLRGGHIPDPPANELTKISESLRRDAPGILDRISSRIDELDGAGGQVHVR